MTHPCVRTAGFSAAAIAAGVIASTSAIAQSLAPSEPRYTHSIQTETSPRAVMPRRSERFGLETRSYQQHVEPQAVQPQPGAMVPEHLRRQIVDRAPRKAEPGAIIIDTANTYLYLVLDDGRAMRYGIGVGRDGFAWSGSERIARKAEWPDWRPPQSMIERQPYLPRFMAGGEGNPMGARAMYLGNSLYRIHGTNAPETIGKKVSSGCIRMLNEDVIDLYSRVNVGTRVVVLPDGPRTAPEAVARAEQPADSGTRSTIEQPERTTERRVGSYRSWQSGIY